MADSHHKGHLNNGTQTGVFVRREKDGKTTEQRDHKKGDESSLMRGLQANQQSVQITGLRSANLPKLECLKVEVCFF